MKRVLTAGLALIAAASIGACSDNSGPSQTSTTTSASSSASADPMTNPNTPPPASALDAMLKQALDPSIPSTQKTKLVQGSQADPTIFDKLVQGFQKNPGITWKFTGIPLRDASNPDTAKVNVQVTLPNNPPQTVPAQIVFDQGRWKLSSNTVCTLSDGLGVKTKMCPATS
ncbi:hypothetical protein [Jongsikchunia kroppenstedtii]|uniref:hypothetical protein n=1 Tax=Jongsikchunia kroppenstedtii TaxID=1121721 RepID=UPI0003817313|nr:hypothetical protein [Jongsikchunia kroppenstedtii]